MATPPLAPRKTAPPTKPKKPSGVQLAPEATGDKTVDRILWDLASKIEGVGGNGWSTGDMQENPLIFEDGMRLEHIRPTTLSPIKWHLYDKSARTRGKGVEFWMNDIKLFDVAGKLASVPVAAIDHGSISGLGDAADHTWAALVDGSRDITGLQDFNASLRLKESANINYLTLAQAADAARTITFPDTTTTLAGLATAQTFTAINKFETSVGIGSTSAPSVLLHVVGPDGKMAALPTLDADTAFMVENNGPSYLQLMSPANSSNAVNFGDADDPNIGQVLYTHSLDQMDMMVNNTSQMRIDSSGHVHINTGSRLVFNKGTSNLYLSGVDSGTNNFIQFNSLAGIAAQIGRIGGQHRFNFSPGVRVYTADNGIIGFGTGEDAAIRYSNAQTPNSWQFGVSADSRALMIVERADMPESASFNFAHPLQTNPTVFIHSATQSTTQWMGMTHDVTDGVISTGAGDVQIAPASGLLKVRATEAAFMLDESDATLDEGKWRFLASGDALAMQAIDDDELLVGTFLDVGRTGKVIDTVTLYTGNAARLVLNSTGSIAVAGGAIQIGDQSGNLYQQGTLVTLTALQINDAALKSAANTFTELLTIDYSATAAICRLNLLSAASQYNVITFRRAGVIESEIGLRSTADDFYFWVNGAERLVIMSDGALKVATSIQIGDQSGNLYQQGTLVTLTAAQINDAALKSAANTFTALQTFNNTIKIKNALNTNHYTLAQEDDAVRIATFPAATGTISLRGMSTWTFMASNSVVTESSTSYVAIAICTTAWPGASFHYIKEAYLEVVYGQNDAAVEGNRGYVQLYNNTAGTEITSDSTLTSQKVFRSDDINSSLTGDIASLQVRMKNAGGASTQIWVARLILVW